MTPMGFERSQFPSGNDAVSKSGGSKNGNIAKTFGERTVMAKPTDPDLAAVVAGWADLPPAIRAGIVAMVKAATPTGGSRIG